ncbi:MAG: hypothetical protein H6905_09655 [Hyphomicrobiales bacterium]|nr:hypothetical protein [Hyphomicrobiales bacterium]
MAGGRPLGSVGWRADRIRSLMAKHDADPAEVLFEALGNETDPDEKRRIALDLMPYCYPKLRSVHVEHDPEEDEFEDVDEYIRKLDEERIALGLPPFRTVLKNGKKRHNGANHDA